METEYDVECFRRRTKGKLRHGVWIMTRKTGSRGMFIHGDRDEIEAPRYVVEDLRDSDGGFVEAITPAELLEEVASWPEAAREAQACFDRHVLQADGEGTK